MTDEQPRPPKGRPFNAELTPAIMDAVLSVLVETGYARLTTAAVAKRAGVSTATLYRRWASKSELLLATAEQIIAEEPVDIDTGSTEGDMREFLAHKGQMLTGRVGAALAALAGEVAHNPELAALMHASFFEPTRQHLDLIFDRARARGEVIGVPAEAVTNLVMGMILARTVFPHAAGERLFISNDIDLLIRAITREN
jgi:hypothetical protein